MALAIDRDRWAKHISLTLYLLVGQHREDFEHKLIYDLFKTGYSKEALPVMNKSEAIEVMFDMAYSQLIYLVRNLIIRCKRKTYKTWRKVKRQLSNVVLSFGR